MTTTPLPQDEVIRMAHEVGLTVGTNISGVTLIGSPAYLGIAHITVDEMTAFATQARADLEAENKRLMENLRRCENFIQEQGYVLDYAASAALKESNHD